MMKGERNPKELLSPKQVARAIGVSEASMKRWCDKGLIEATRTMGGHRRLPLSSVVNFIRESGHKLLEPEVIGLPAISGSGTVTIEKAGVIMREALERGDEAQFTGIAFQLYMAKHRICDILDRAVAPAFHDLGDKWSHGSLEVYQERLGCELCMRLLHGFRMVLPDPSESAPMAIGGTLEGDPYLLATKMAEISLREIGWRAESYGSGHPLDTLCAAIRRHRPKLLWLSISVVTIDERFLARWSELYETATQCGTALVIGGRALVEDVRKQLRYTAFCDSMSHLVAFAQSLQPNVAGSVAAAKPAPATGSLPVNQQNHGNGRNVTSQRFS